MIAERVPALPSIAADVLRGLTRSPKALPPTLFYDSIGSSLFEQITALPEYYLTRTETGILEDKADEIVSRVGSGVTLIEFGAGTAAKTRILIRALLRLQGRAAFYPVDVSSEPLRGASEELPREFTALSVHPVVADYTAGNHWLERIPGRKFVLYIGSSIGNFEPFQATALLAQLRRSLSPGDALLLGTDMAKDPTILVPAYDDAQGVTAQFNLNMLARINRELRGHFDLQWFRHIALWNARCSRIEIYLESLREQLVAIDLLRLQVLFARGERIHTENSYKFTASMIEAIMADAGFRLEATWSDARAWFTVHLARV